MKKSIITILFLCAIPLGLFLKDRFQPTSGASYKIAINQFIEHPNLADLFEGFKETLDAWCVKTDKTVEYKIQNANGDFATARLIARQQASSDADLILALATPSAQASAAETQVKPILFGAVTDPIGAGLVKSWAAPGVNCTGTSDIAPFDEQISLMIEILPSIKQIGVIRNPGEANSVASFLELQKALRANGLLIIEVAISSTNEALQAANSLVGRCEAIYLPADNTVLSGIAAIAQIANRHKLPLFVTDVGSVKLGGVATLGIDYRELGKATGSLAIRVLNGENPSKIPVTKVNNSLKTYINKRAAVAQGITFPDSVLKRAVEVETTSADDINH